MLPNLANFPMILSISGRESSYADINKLSNKYKRDFKFKIRIHTHLMTFAPRNEASTHAFLPL
jgi:hypothetical protein